MEPEVAEVAELAERLAREAAQLLLDRLEGARDVGTKSSSTDMVTEVDRESERLIVGTLEAERPADAILAEEGGTAGGTSGFRWVVDPLDGTTNYLYRHPGFAVSIAVERDGETVVGVVCDPLHGDVFTAVRGGGALRNGDPIGPSGTSDLSQALIATGFGYDPDQRGEQGLLVARILPRIRDIRRMGAAAVDLCSVACGRVDAFYERGLQAWDLAAGALIAAEAGAEVGPIEAGAPIPGSVLAAAPPLFEPLRGLLADAGAGE